MDQIHELETELNQEFTVFGCKNIRDLFKTINEHFISKEKQTIKAICENCQHCYHEYDGDYGEIDCGYICSKDDIASDDVNFPYQFTKDCFELNDLHYEGYCIFSTIDECSFLTKEQKDKIYNHFKNKNMETISIETLKET